MLATKRKTCGEIENDAKLRANKETHTFGISRSIALVTFRFEAVLFAERRQFEPTHQSSARGRAGSGLEGLQSQSAADTVSADGRR